MPYRCGYCGGSFCPSHRLPENHECEGLEEVSEESRRKGQIYRGISDDLKTEPKRDRKEETERIPFDLRGGTDEKPFSVGIWDLIKNFFFGNMTFLLILIMIIVFIGGVTAISLLGESTYYQILRSWLIPVKSTFLLKPWTLLTHIFLHSTFLHLLGNMILFFFTGIILEKMVSRNKFIVLFLATGVIGSLVQLYFLGPEGSVLGASGAIFGILGALTIMAPRMPILFFFVPMKIWILSLAILFVDILNALIFPEEPVAHLSHYGGFLAGLIFGYKFRKDQERKARDFFKMMMGQ